MSRKFYKEHDHGLLFDESERSQFFKELERVVSEGDRKKVNQLIEVLIKEGKTDYLATYRSNEGESILHIAAKFNQTSVIKRILKICPELVIAARTESSNFGQMAIHIAIAKNNTTAVKIMLSEEYNQSLKDRSTLLHQPATGDKFANTVMMGELPLSVAALMFNHGMLNILLNHGAKIDRQNTKGDMVFHSLIRFAAIYPQKKEMVLDTMDYLHKKISKKLEVKSNLIKEYDLCDNFYVWFIPNNDDLNALQLAATLSQDAIFEFILELPNVYCFFNSHDGLFDRKSYDVTEIDTIATEKWASDEKTRQNRQQRHAAPTKAEGVSQHRFSNKTSTSCSPFRFLKRETRKSVLEMMFDIKSSAAFQFIQQPTVRHVIKTKWLTYRYYYYIWMLFHLLFMTTLTFYAVYKAEDFMIMPDTEKTSTTTPTTMPDSAAEKSRTKFLEVVSWVFFFVGILHLLHEIIHVLFRVKSHDPVQLFSILHNGLYRIILTIFSVSLILDFVLDKSIPDYENLMLIVALISGWWFSVFFLRAHKKFSFFTVMILKVIFGDMIRFSLIISVMIIAFTAAIFMTFKGSNTQNDNLFSYANIMMLLFKLMLGLGDIEELYEARRPWMAIALFIVFVVLTYVLMLNALIAMMSQTCTMVSENRHVQWRVQQLSLILFFEGILPLCMIKIVGEEKHVKRNDPKMGQEVEEKRYFLDICSLQTDYANAEDILSIKKSMQTLPFGDYQSSLYTMQMPMSQYVKSSPATNFDQNEEIADNHENACPLRKSKRNFRNRRVYPADDINKFYRHLIAGRQRHHSENDLDIYTSRPMQCSTLTGVRESETL